MLFNYISAVAADSDLRGWFRVLPLDSANHRSISRPRRFRTGNSANTIFYIYQLLFFLYIYISQQKSTKTKKVNEM